MPLAVTHLSTDESQRKTPANTAVVGTESRKNSPRVSHLAKLSTYSATLAPILSAMWSYFTGYTRFKLDLFPTSQRNGNPSFLV